MSVQTEIVDHVNSRSCAHGKKDIFDEESPQFCEHCKQNVCHECWHAQYPEAYCLVCDTEE
jgi:hypothetical protein